MAVETDELMGKIGRTREQLRRMPPGLKGSEVVKMKNKLKHLQLLEKIRLNAREMCLNNLILPIIDKLHVQKLRQVCQLVACISNELPELGGIATVTFGCVSIDREQDEAVSPEKHAIAEEVQLLLVSYQFFIFISLISVVLK